jgi:hypothetical protein
MVPDKEAVGTTCPLPEAVRTAETKRMSNGLHTKLMKISPENSSAYDNPEFPF